MWASIRGRKQNAIHMNTINTPANMKDSVLCPKRATSGLRLSGHSCDALAHCCGYNCCEPPYTGHSFPSPIGLPLLHPHVHDMGLKRYGIQVTRTPASGGTRGDIYRTKLRWFWVRCDALALQRTTCRRLSGSGLQLQAQRQRCQVIENPRTPSS